MKATPFLRNKNIYIFECQKRALKSVQLKNKNFFIFQWNFLTIQFNCLPLGSFHRRFKLATGWNEIFRACGTDPWWKSLYCITWNNFPTYRGRARINSEIVRITGGRDRVWLKSRTARTHSAVLFSIVGPISSRTHCFSFSLLP